MLKKSHLGVACVCTLKSSCGVWCRIPIKDGVSGRGRTRLPAKVDLESQFAVKSCKNRNDEINTNEGFLTFFTILKVDCNKHIFTPVQTPVGNLHQEEGKLFFIIT